MKDNQQDKLEEEIEEIFKRHVKEGNHGTSYMGPGGKWALKKAIKNLIDQAKREAVEEYKELIEKDVKNGIEYNIHNKYCNEKDLCNITDIQIFAYLNYWLVNKPTWS